MRTSGRGGHASKAVRGVVLRAATALRHLPVVFGVIFGLGSFLQRGSPRMVLVSRGASSALANWGPPFVHQLPSCRHVRPLGAANGPMPPMIGPTFMVMANASCRGDICFLWPWAHRHWLAAGNKNEALGWRGLSFRIQTAPMHMEAGPASGAVTCASCKMHEQAQPCRCS